MRKFLILAATAVSALAVATPAAAQWYPPQYNNYPRVVVEGRRMASGTEVTLMVEPFGDQELSRSVLDGVLQRLGL